MTTTPRCLILLVLSLVIMGGCADSESDSSSPATSSDTTASNTTASQRATVPDTSSANATSEASRYEAPQGFPLPFTTTVPGGWRTQQVDRSVGKTIRFYRDTGARPSVLELYLYRPGSTRDGIETRIREKAQDMGTAQEQPPDYDWAFTSYAFESERMEGTLRAGQRDSLFFYVMTSHPPDADSTFVRQAETMLEQWQWQ